MDGKVCPKNMKFTPFPSRSSWKRLCYIRFLQRKFSEKVFELTEI